MNFTTISCVISTGSKSRKDLEVEAEYIQPATQVGSIVLPQCAFLILPSISFLI
jgi:hypothetical protein